MSRRVGLAVGLALLLAITGCATSRKLATRDQFAELPAGQLITVFAKDDRTYELHQYVLRDSLLHGSGTVSQRHKKSPFEGDIPFSEIIAVKTDTRSRLKGFAIAGITAMFIGYLGDGTGGNTGLTPTLGTGYVGPYTGIGTGTSCPYVYAWDGTQYRLQAEPFGIGWGKALELTTVHLLPAARAEHGIVRLRLTNEREETHYVNSIGLRRIALGTAPAAILDGEGRAWPLAHPVGPLAARDRSGRDILPEIAAVDARRWECEPSSLTPGSGYEDVLDVSFQRPRGAIAGLLVLAGINTTLSTALYAHMCRIGGGQAAVLWHAVETDPELIAELRAYLRDASLKVDVWNGHDWEPAGAFSPEANAVAFTRALRIRVPAGAGDTVRVRLRSMADMWKIDALSADWSDASPLPMTSVELRSAVGPLGEDVRNEIGADDTQYAILLPPDRVDLTFAAAPAEAGDRVAYAVAARGYLLEWEPRPAGDGSTALASFVPDERKIAFLKEALRHRELALEPVYEEWRKLRAR